MKKETILVVIAVIVVALEARALLLLTKKESAVKSSQSFDEPVVEITKDKNKLQELITAVGIRNVMDRLVKESNNGTTYDCHQYAHIIGRVGYFAKKQQAFVDCTADCESGCYHGAMEGLFTEEGTEHFAASVEEICSKFQTGFNTFSCLHGSGHGVMYESDYDMPAAIKKCQEFPDQFSKSSCYGGVFMENVMIGIGAGVNPDADHHTDWLNQTDPLYPCDKVDQEYHVQYECYQMQTSWMLYLEKYNFDNVVKDCLKAKKDMMPVCFKSFGRDAAGHSLRNPQKILDLCAKVPKISDYYDQCITGAVNVIVEYQSSKVNDEAINFCKMVDESHKKACYSAIILRLPGLFQDNNDQIKMCNMFESRYQPLCLSMVNK